MEFGIIATNAAREVFDCWTLAYRAAVTDSFMGETYCRTLSEASW